MPTRLSTALCGLAILLGTVGAFARPAAAEDRTLTFMQMHTGETLTVTYKHNGRYIPSAMKKINYILRDWRRNEATTMDPKLVDLLWEVHKKTGSHDAIHVLSGYRSPVTNAALRANTSGVAKYSQHMLGKATDFYLPDVKLATLRATALRMQVGGVGFYPTSGSPFVHLDTGSVRHWPRMSRTQLARIFPDGKTLHIPADGKPLEGYQIALAEAERRKSGQSTGSSSGSRTLLASLGLGGGGQSANADDPSRAVRPQGGKNFFAALFNGGEGDEEQEANGKAPAAEPETAVATAAPAAPEAAPEPKPVQVAALEAPLPPARPQIAANDDINAVLASNADVPTPDAKPTAIAALDAAQEPEPAAQQARLDVPLPPVPPAPDPVVVAGIMPPSRPLVAAAAPAVKPGVIEPNIVTALAPTGERAGRNLPFDRTFKGGALTTTIRLVPMDLRIELVDAVAMSATLWRTGNGVDMKHPDQHDLSGLIVRDGHMVDNRFEPRRPLDYANRFKGEPINHVPVKTLTLAANLPN